MSPEQTTVATEYYAILASEAAKWRIIKRRAQRYPHEKLVTAVAEVERDDRKAARPDAPRG